MKCNTLIYILKHVEPVHFKHLIDTKYFWAKIFVCENKHYTCRSGTKVLKKSTNCACDDDLEPNKYFAIVFFRPTGIMPKGKFSI